ncbi:MAG: OmcA/MtrC family decaheme c-type cytochrome [Bryobacteraceae bacterium]|nr:OmcA/MtrC family decaheme c-type cytochrome [Bryobacteraceae bacterium]
MRFRISPVAVIRCLLAFVLLAGAAALISETKSPFTERDKAYYADENLVNFVRPGLTIKILSASIAADGTIQVRYRVSDPRDLPLDRAGVTTPGTIATSFIAATIPAGQTQYTSYTVRTQTSPITNQSAIQAAGENNGTFTKVADGEYTYTFRTKAPSNIDRNAVHTIGAYGSRNLSEFDLGTNYDDDVFSFIPATAAVVSELPRDVVRTATCNKCHDQLAFHGGSRRTMELCVLCHTPQTVDPDTGNTVDMPVMTHKIHMGANLPSVKAGTPYKIIGNAQSVHDYSHIRFPASFLLAGEDGGLRDCTTCHTGDAKQKDNYITSGSRAVCGSCHDDVNFATGEGHANLPQVSDNRCTTCHTPEGELEFDISIKGAHTVPTRSRDLPGVVWNIESVTNTAPGEKPVVVFTQKTKRGEDIKMSDMTRLALVLSGPTTDYVSPTSRGYVSEDILRTTTDLGGGRLQYTFTNAIPADAKGTFTVGIEGYRNMTLLAGTNKQMTVRDAGDNATKDFSVDGTEVAKRRQVVALEKCLNCHPQFSIHGGNRDRIEQCVLCHNPLETDASRRPAAQNPPESINFMTMVHRVHSGNAQSRTYTIYGFGGTPHNYNDVGYPGRLQNCNGCHVNNSQQLPLPSTNSRINDPRGPINPMGPTTAACTGCHASTAAASHALTNTSSLGEACAACHGQNSEFSVNRVHAQ